MDYCTLANVRAEMKISEVTDDALLSYFITAASRALDRRCTGESDESAHNYFQLQSVTDEVLYGLIGRSGDIVCRPHKPVVKSITAFSYRENVTKDWYSVDVSRCEYITNKVTAFPLNLSLRIPSRCTARISYTGGFSGSTAGLPEDLQEICALLVARFYREAESGLSDAIGVPEIGQLIYTKAWPSRVLDQMDTFIRREGWNYPG